MSNLALLDTAPYWVKPYNPNFDLDFVNRRAYGGSIQDLLSASSSTGYAERQDGIWVSFAANILRITDKGIRIEATKTNVVLHNRDITNAAWTNTDITAAKDQTGIDGVANSASSITATGANGTSLQAITLGSSARWQSAFVKRITGSGTVEMTMDNGTTWTAVTVTSGWTRVEIPSQTLANPTVGFRIVTSGDAIAVDFVQNENNGFFASSPIAVTTVAVARGNDTISTAGRLKAFLALGYGTCLVQTNLNLGTNNMLSTANSTDNYSRANSPTSAIIRANSLNTAATVGGSGSFTTGRVKTGTSWDANGNSCAANNSAVSTSVNVLTPTATSYLGSQNGSIVMSGLMERITLWPYRLSDNLLKSLTVL